MSLTEQEHANLVAMVTKGGKKAWFIEHRNKLHCTIVFVQNQHGFALSRLCDVLLQVILCLM